MVTVVGKTAEGLGVYRGLSTDLPLDPAPKNGSRFFAMDNGKTYWYDAASDTWEGYSGGGGGGGDLPEGYVWVEDVIIKNSTTTDDCATRQKALADAIVEYCAALPDDEMCLLTHVNGYSYELVPLYSKEVMDNTLTSLSLYAERSDVNYSNQLLSSRTLRIATTAANNYYYAMTIKTDGTYTLTDNSSVTNSNDIQVHLDRYKKIGG